jgi:hypothetical protein
LKIVVRYSSELQLLRYYPPLIILLFQHQMILLCLTPDDVTRQGMSSATHGLIGLCAYADIEGTRMNPEISPNSNRLDLVARSR